MLKKSSIIQPEIDFQDKLIKSQCLFSSPESINYKFTTNNFNRNFPIRIYNTAQNTNNIIKNFSVSSESKINKINEFSPVQSNINKKLYQNSNITSSYSDLLTRASFSSQKSTESFISSNKNITQFSQNNIIFIPNKDNIIVPTNRELSNNLPNFYYNFYNQINNNNNINNINKNNINSIFSKELRNNFNKNKINKRISQNFNNGFNNSFSINFNNENINFFEYKKFFNNIFKNNNNYNNININNIKINDHINIQKSIDFSGQNFMNSDDIISIEAFNQQNIKKINCINNNINKNNDNLEKNNKKKNKLFYNKFSFPKDNFKNENTVILTLKIKVAKNDFRYFNLKKYDDLFVSLEKFVNLNKIKQELVKPIVTKIFMALNKIFWLLNNKIGEYDQGYLNSLYKLWIKNNKIFPNDNKYNTNHKRNHSEKSTTSSSDSSNENSFENIKSNSFQNIDGNNSEDKVKKKTKTI